MADATYVNGKYTPFNNYVHGSADISAGAMVLLGSVAANSTTGAGAVLGIAHRDIANGAQDSLAIGGGIYDCVIASNYAAGVMLFKPSGNAILTTTATNNARFGPLLEASAAANAVCQVLHDPIP